MEGGLDDLPMNMYLHGRGIFWWDNFKFIVLKTGRKSFFRYQTTDPKCWLCCWITSFNPEPEPVLKQLYEECLGEKTTTTKIISHYKICREQFWHLIYMGKQFKHKLGKILKLPCVGTSQQLNMMMPTSSKAENTILDFHPSLNQFYTNLTKNYQPKSYNLRVSLAQGINNNNQYVSAACHYLTVGLRIATVVFFLAKCMWWEVSST